MPYSSTNVKLYRFKTGKAFTKGQRFALDLPLDNAGAIFDLPSALSFLSCAPFKLEPEMEIKLELDSAFAIPVNVEDYDYAIIQADGGTGRVNNLPYFIEKIDRISDQVVRVSLLFDELNFMSAIGSADGIAGFLSDRTRVTREHKDRFVKSKTGNSYLPVIDRFPEGISGNFHRTSKEAIELSENVKTGKGFDWTAFYFSDGTDASSPISSFLVADEPLFQKTLKAAEDSLSVNPTTGYPNSSSVYFCLSEASSTKISFNQLTSQNTRVMTLGETAQIDGRDCIVLAGRVWYRYDSATSTSGAYLYKLWYDKNGLFVKEEQVGGIENLLNNITAPKCARVFSGTSARPTSMAAILRLPTLDIFFKKDVDDLDRIVAESDIDRTALGLKKAICLPYRPFDRDASGYLPEGCFVVAGKILLARDDLESTISFAPKGRNLRLPYMTAKPTEATDGKATALQLEPKVYSSEFRFSKLVYDSFSIVLKGEDTYFNSNLSETGNDKIVFKFFASPSMVSEFDFSIYSYPGYSASEFILSPIWTEDYPLHLIINRNNETPVYTSAYLDYLRTGYNYDLKSQAVQLGMQGLGIAISAINAGVGIAATFTPGVGIAAAPYAVSAATGFASSIANIGKTAAENQRGNAQRLKELQAQGASVAGNSDFAVSKRYTKNRVSLETYSVEPRLINSARSFFYLKGYATDEIKAPSCHNRAHFDFVECDPVFQPEALSLFPKWMLDLIADDLRQGVTVMHPVSGDYDIAQQSSNYELSVLNS